MSLVDEGYPLAQFQKTYFEECDELLDSLQSNITALSNGDKEALHASFRSVHSIKGGAGAFGFSSLVAFAHVYESLLDAMRDDALSVTPELTEILLRAGDALADIVSFARSDFPVPDQFAADVLIAMKEALQATSEDATSVSRLTSMANTSHVVRRTRYKIEFAPSTEMFRRANEPLLLLRQLRKLGDLTVIAHTAGLPLLNSIDPEAAYFSWTCMLETNGPRTSVQEVFEFVEDDCNLSIEAEGEPAELTAEETRQVLQSQTAVALKEAEALSSALLLNVAAPTTLVSTPAQSIRVDVDRVDRLVNLVGELVITQAMLIEQGAMLPAGQYPALIQGIESLAQSAREMQESVMAIRAQPVKSVFARMPRVVRDLAAVLGKEVRIITLGEMTEIDKTVIEQLGDPLTHMIRNALDHGIEGPAERELVGKPRQGTIQLSAAQRSGRIVIEVADDGRGLDRDKVLARARARGLLAPTAVLSDEEIDNLIFLPAFSTADVISSISGRGVGMDVVKRNVLALGGRISVHSRFGYGSRFRLSLPLTLAVEDGMVVAVGCETFIIPLTAIVESLRPRPSDIHSLAGRGKVIALRGEYLPLTHLYQCFSIEGAISDPCKGIVIIVQSENAGRIGVVVDELLGQQQVVVKSLEANYDAVDGITGATILGNGRVALIIDIARMQMNPADHSFNNRMPYQSRQREPSEITDHAA